MNLNQEQLKAVQAHGDSVLVLAGAGSGKTRILIERIAYLIEEKKVSPYEICALTFTRKAAGEMKKRLIDRLGSHAHHITMGTMHGIALNLLHRFGDALHYHAKNITVYGEWESQYLLREVAIDLGIYNGKTWKIKKKDVDAMFDSLYERGIEPDETDPLRPLFREFMNRCLENNALTYGSLLLGMRLLFSIDSVVKYLHWRHILVDEVQDIDTLQWQIINVMCEKLYASLYCVGDIDQSIYEWRGAIPQYLLENQDCFNVYRLETNYRSVPEIVEVANQVIAHNESRFEKNMVAVRENEGGKVHTLQDMDSAALANYIKCFIHDNYQMDGFVVLARKRALLRKLSELLAEKEIPHTVVGEKTDLINSEEFRRFHAFLKLVVNPYDNFAFLLIRDLIGLSREEYGKIRLQAVQERKSHFQVWREGADDNSIFMAFFESVHGWCFDEIIVNMDCQEFEWPFDIQSIKAFVLNWCREDGGACTDYLDWLATYDVQDEIEESEDQLQLMTMTIHGAKGLEWPNVIIAGCNEGIIPSTQAIRGGDIEAERRLMYVAMTRAQDNLIITVRPDDDGKSPESRFIKESDI